MILALETSCDDTCAAVVTGAGEVCSNVISSQGVHDRYGGVVPEIASRHHLELVNAVVDDALARAGAGLGDVTLVAVTQGPGLVGALLVGVATAKGLAAARRLPLAPVDHLQGHVAATYLEPEPMEPPFLCLLASGGHTLLARVTEPGARLALGGGVAANARLRERAAGLGVELKVPPSALCTDNAAMIASAARWVEPLPFPDYLGLDAYATRRAA